MKQYCRYCAFCHTDFDWHYCTIYEIEMSKKRITRENHCPDFALSELGDVESGKPYRPRKKVGHMDSYEQLHF